MVADPKSSTYAQDYITAQSVITKEMDTIDTNFFNVKKNTYQVYVSQTCLKLGPKCQLYPQGTQNLYKVYADMKTAPQNTNVYFDEAMGGNFLIGNLGYVISKPGSKSNELKFMETKLINQGFGSSSYYDPFYKIFSGLIIDGALSVSTPPVLPKMVNPIAAPQNNDDTVLPNGVDIWTPGQPGGGIHFGAGYLNFNKEPTGKLINFKFTSADSTWTGRVHTWDEKENPDVSKYFTCSPENKMPEPTLSPDKKSITIHCKIIQHVASINSGDFGMVWINKVPDDLSTITVEKVPS